MAWNSDLPSNSEKIRNLGVVIRPNWKAIEEGDDVGVSDMLQMRSVQLDNRTGLALNDDPVTNVGTHYIYSKDDGGGVQEAFMKDSAGNVIQLTSDGSLGGSTTSIEISDFSFTANMLPTALCVVPAAGTSFTREINFANATRPGTGQYTLVTDTVFTNANVFLSVTPDVIAGNSSTAQINGAVTIAGGALTIKVLIRNKDGNNINGGFHVIVHGGIT